jgi:hypothetical protein
MRTVAPERRMLPAARARLAERARGWLPIRPARCPSRLRAPRGGAARREARSRPVERHRRKAARPRARAFRPPNVSGSMRQSRRSRLQIPAALAYRCRERPRMRRIPGSLPSPIPSSRLALPRRGRRWVSRRVFWSLRSVQGQLPSGRRERSRPEGRRPNHRQPEERQPEELQPNRLQRLEQRRPNRRQPEQRQPERRMRTKPWEGWKLRALLRTARHLQARTQCRRRARPATRMERRRRVPRACRATRMEGRRWPSSTRRRRPARCT